MEQGLKEWAVGLIGLSDRQIQEGFEKMLREGRRFPPTLPEFVALCRSGASMASSKPLVKRIRLDSDKLKARAAIRRIREVLH